MAYTCSGQGFKKVFHASCFLLLDKMIRFSDMFRLLVCHLCCTKTTKDNCCAGTMKKRWGMCKEGQFIPPSYCLARLTSRSVPECLYDGWQEKKDSFEVEPHMRDTADSVSYVLWWFSWDLGFHRSTGWSCVWLQHASKIKLYWIKLNLNLG